MPKKEEETGDGGASGSSNSTVFRSEEYAVLLDLVERYYGRLFGRSPDPDFNTKRREKWEEIAASINRIYGGIYGRTWRSCKTKWENMKSLAKKKLGQHRYHETGGGPEPPAYNNIDLEVLRLIGDSPSFVAINPPTFDTGIELTATVDSTASSDSSVKRPGLSHAAKHINAVVVPQASDMVLALNSEDPVAPDIRELLESVSLDESKKRPAETQPVDFEQPKKKQKTLGPQRKAATSTACRPTLPVPPGASGDHKTANNEEEEIYPVPPEFENVPHIPEPDVPEPTVKLQMGGDAQASTSQMNENQRVLLRDIKCKNLTLLSEDALVLILEHVKPADRVAFSLLGKKAKIAAAAPHFWETVNINDFLIARYHQVHVIVFLVDLGDVIRKFEMHHTSQFVIESYVLSELVKQFTYVREVDLSGCDMNVTDIEFVPHLTRLEKLNISGCEGIPSHRFRSGLNHNRHLKTLIMRELHNIDEGDIMAVTHTMHKLEFLDTFLGAKLSPAAVLAIFQFSHYLEKFYFSAYYFHTDIYMWLLLTRKEFPDKRYHFDTIMELADYEADF